MKLSELLKYKTPEDRLKLTKTSNCAECEIVLQEAITGCRETHKGYMCSDCYYDMMGEMAEEYPIGIPRMHRGA